jgi:hypothetical protein
VQQAGNGLSLVVSWEWLCAAGWKRAVIGSIIYCISENTKHNPYHKIQQRNIIWHTNDNFGSSEFTIRM